MQAVKLVISGPFNAGKSQFIAAASEIEPVRTERRVTDHTAAVKATTTAAMDFGRLTIKPGLALHLYGTPGHRRFDFMWQALARGMRGLLLVVDSTDSNSFVEARSIFDFFQTLVPVPCVVAANKQDRRGAVNPSELATALEVAAEQVVPSVATEPASVRSVLSRLLAHIPPVVSETDVRVAEPIAPRSPARLIAVEWSGSRQHLTQGEGSTLCGRIIPVTALPALIYREEGCQVCTAAASRAGLTCADCGRPLTRSRDSRYCLGCAERRRTAPRDAIALAVDLV
jgi:signal recognition particle receptor subunit beta